MGIAYSDRARFFAGRAMSTAVEESIGTTLRDEIDPDTGEPRATHIVVPGPNDRDAVASVMRARIEGVPVTALCGKTWVPQHDPKQYPLCSKCKAIREESRPDQNPEDIPS